MMANIFKAVPSLLSRMRPEALLIFSFAASIFLGTLLLWCPLSHRGAVGFSEALFTATSAVCVTGLIVVDTGTAFTLFGQCVILALIQIGGLGVMTFAALAFDLLGRRLSLSGQEAMTNELVHEEIVHGFRKYFRKMVFLVVAIEGVGAALLLPTLSHVHGFTYGLYSAVFHAISAFCNAGFSLYSDSLIAFSKNWAVLGIIGSLIIVGGIGYPVLFDFARVIGLRRTGDKSISTRFSLHTRIAIATTAFLLFAGFILLILTSGYRTNIGLNAALFQSITARTAGFNSIRIETMPLAAILILIILMFIGGSPGSCAGGVKTTTFALWISQLWNRLLGRTQVVIFDRRIPEPIARRSSTLISAAMLWNIFGVLLLSLTEAHAQGFGLRDILFEQISAFGTVGLSTGLTPKLGEAGRVWIVLTMFIGRTGPLTSVLLLLRRKATDIGYPEGKVMIG